MDETVFIMGDVTTLYVGTDGHALNHEGDVAAFIGNAWAARAHMIALPLFLIGSAFFDLRSGVLGAVAQKFVNYKLRVAIIGDVSKHERASKAFRDFVREANRGRDMWFVADIDMLRNRLEAESR